jgi:hypothetical protein
MYAGHFGAGLALKARYPQTPTWIPLLGVGVLDILFGPFVLAGIERVTVTPGIPPGFRLDYIDWSHSLLMALVWSALYAVLFLRQGKTIASVAGVSVFSHFVLDLPMHPADLALWPGSSIHIGLDLWHRLPTGWWFIELAAILVGAGYYWFAARRSRQFGGRAGWAVAVVLLLHLLNAPWFAPK